MTRICIIAAPFYADITAEMVRGANVTLKTAGATVEIIEVPGAFEIPAVVRLAIESGKFDGYVALGCVIRGETSHYDYVCGESARGLNDLAIRHMAAIGYGILTVENREQAWERAAIAKGNKGHDAATACLRMLELKTQLGVI